MAYDIPMPPDSVSVTLAVGLASYQKTKSVRTEDLFSVEQYTCQAGLPRANVRRSGVLNPLQKATQTNSFHPRS